MISIKAEILDYNIEFKLNKLASCKENLSILKSKLIGLEDFKHRIVPLIGQKCNTNIAMCYTVFTNRVFWVGNNLVNAQRNNFRFTCLARLDLSKISYNSTAKRKSKSVDYTLSLDYTSYTGMIIVAVDEPPVSVTTVDLEEDLKFIRGSLGLIEIPPNTFDSVFIRPIIVTTNYLEAGGVGKLLPSNHSELGWSLYRI